MVNKQYWNVGGHILRNMGFKGTKQIYVSKIAYILKTIRLYYKSCSQG